MSETLLNRAGEWFAESGIQEATGGVARYYRSDLKQNARVSTEITGYAAGALAWLHTRTGNERYLELARKSACFLATRAWDPRAEVFPFEDGGEALGYFFDTGIIIRGLLSVWRLTGDEHLLTVATRAGEALYRHFRAGEHFHPILQLPAMTPTAHEPRWSRSPGCYQLKVALAWAELAEARGDARFRDWYEELLASSLACHDRFLVEVEDSEKRMDRLHPYSYFLEGMLPACDREQVQCALATGIRRVEFYLREIAPLFERSDVSAQLLRVRLLADAAGAVKLDEAPAAEEARRAASFQLESDDRRENGGFGFGRARGALLPYVNPVSTAFCLQAIDLWNLRRQGAPLPGWTALI